MIPKIIHYCWFGGKPLPNSVKECIKSWRKYCPDYEIKEWNESNFDVKSHPFMKEAFDAHAWAFVSDYARLKIVYDYGGIYLDTDVELLKPIDFLLVDEGFIGVQQSRLKCTTGLGFGAKKNNTIVKYMLDKYDELQFDKEKTNTFMCPIMNNMVFEELGYNYSDGIQKINGFAIYPAKYFDPVAPGHMQEDLLCEDSISVHHYSASWTSTSSKLRRKIQLCIGQQRVNKIKKLLGR